MRDLTEQELRDIDHRTARVLRGLQLYDIRGAEDGVFAQDAAVLCGFIRGEIREAVYRMTATIVLPDRPEQAQVDHEYSCKLSDTHGCTCGPEPAPRTVRVTRRTRPDIVLEGDEQAPRGAPRDTRGPLSIAQDEAAESLGPDPQGALGADDFKAHLENEAERIASGAYELPATAEEEASAPKLPSAQRCNKGHRGWCYLRYGHAGPHRVRLRTEQ